jgi:hypothetical protein
LAAQQIIDIATKGNEATLFINLISGGRSALLACPGECRLHPSPLQTNKKPLNFCWLAGPALTNFETTISFLSTPSKFAIG